MLDRGDHLQVARRVDPRGRLPADREVGLAFAVRFDGFGAKLQWFPGADQRGLFVGAADVTLDGETYDAMDVSVFPAVHVGYRFR